MHQKILYLIIGILIGFIIVQSSITVAQSQTEYIEAGEFNLKDESGNTTASLYNGVFGPTLGIGDPNKRHILMNASLASELGAFIAVREGVNKMIVMAVTSDAVLTITTETLGGVLVKWSGNEGNFVRAWSHAGGGQIITASDFFITAVIPRLLPITALKPGTWGQLKRNPSATLNYSAKPIEQDFTDLALQVDDMVLQIEMEYRQKVESLK